MTDQPTEPVLVDDAEGEEPLPSPQVDPVEQLAHLVPAFWRTMRRASSAAERLPANESQVTILRLVVQGGGLSPSELATKLHIARPTVSNLIKDLLHTGLVERRTLDGNNRSVVISATAEGREVLEAFRRDRAEALRSALSRLPADQQQQVRSSVDALRHLLRELERSVAEPAESAESERESA
ncbi:MarR family winged helix-turn-helix transcriptional regulator [Subtercola sp. YIM 133946]|uniref:MarR family winged helix-turn-helix transcriptional regulator n=1 Tax=Subtercola sp. YIM 133946 TaxID=3118909 RepID=UPI002F940F13